MEERSDYSVNSDKRSTGRELSITPEQALEILQAAILHCQHSGISAKVAPLHGQAQPSIVVVLAGVQIEDGRLVTV